MITRDEELKWAYLLDPCFELTNTAGKPLTDGYIEVYIAGTRNKYYCASDFAGTLHPFQIPLDSLGSNIVLANPDNAYDVYVYNRYGNLIMSRYNVTPADGGAVISNTERINDLEELVVSAVTGLQGQIDDINEALDGKKDKQEEYSVTLTPTQTVSAIMQNENGEIEVIYQEIDLPEEVPNVDIVSPASTINITTHIDEETNTKTFSIDLSDLGHLEYGQFMATQDVYTGANMYRIKGNLNTSLDGKIQLHKGNSYHITVRGYYTCNDLANTADTLNYIEYSTFTTMPVNVDNTVAGPQYFEISYDVFKLSADTNYYIAFASSAGKVSNLTVEIHSLSNISILDPEFNYQEGWGIDIVSSVISVDPTIFNDYSTHTEVYEATVTAIQAATSVVPEIAQSDWAEDDPEAQSYIKNKPDLDVYATHDEVYESSVSSIQLVTGLIPDVSDYATHEDVHESSVTAIQLVTGLIPTDYTTHEEVSEAIVTAIEYVTGIIPDAQVQSDWEQSDDTQPDYIKNKPDLDIYATHDEVNTVSGQIIETVNNVSGQIIETVNNVSGEIIETVNNVSGDIIETVNNVSAVLHGEIQDIPEQVQADWDQSDDTQVDYIKNKPDLSIYATHDEVVSAVSSIDLSEYATHTEVYDSSVTAIQMVTGLIPDVSDFTTHDEVHESIVSALEYVTGIIPDAQVQSDWTETDTTDPAYIKHKPMQTELVAGQNIGIFDNGSNLVIAASGTDLTGYATETDVNSAIVTAINYVTGIIPDAQVQSDWNQTNSNQPDYIKNKPDLDIYTTAEEVIEIVSGVTGLTEYGQFYSTAVSGAAAMARTKGTIDVTNDGKIKLKQGSSYHVTVRGCYNQTTPNNIYSNISYIEYITFSNININVDKTITEPQYFEISYDLYKLNSDTDYYVFFSGLEGTVNDLFIEIHALGGLGGNGSVTGAAEYDAGWGIQILNNVISVNPSIIPDDINLVAGTNIGIIVSGNDLVIAASGSDLSDYATLEQLQDSVELVTGLIPDTSDLATKEELQDGLELVTGLIPTVQLNSSNLVTSINNYPIYSEGGAGTTYTAGDGIDITNNIISVDNTVALKTDIPDEEEVEFEEINLSDYALASAIPDVSNLATHAEVSNATVTAVNYVTGLIPELPDDLNLVAGQNIGITISGNDIVISASVSGVSGYVTQEELIEAVTAVTAAIPAAQVQSDWTEDDNTDPAYILNKPAEYNVVAGQNIGITIDGNDFVICASATDLSGYATTEQLQDSVELVTGLIPTDYATSEDIQDAVELVTGMIPDTSDLATKAELQDGLELVTGLIPDVSDFATEEQLQDGLELVTGMIPEQEEVEFLELTAGNNISIVSGVISATGIPTIQLNSSNQVTAIDNYAIAGGGGSSDSDVFIATYGTTTFGEIYQAYLANKVIYCKGTYATNEDTGILHYYQGYYGNPTFEGVILDGTYEIRVTIRANSNPPSTSDSTANWSGYQTTLALSSQIPATLSAGNGIAITNNTINVDNSVITTGVSGFELPISNFKLDSTGQAYKAESAVPPFVSTGTYDSQWRSTLFAANQFIDLTIPYHLNVSDCRYIVLQYGMSDFTTTTSDDPITDIYIDTSKFNSSFGINICWSTSKTANWANVSTLSETPMTLTSYPVTVTIPNRSQGSGYSMINVSNLERRAYDVTPSEGYTWKWQLASDDDILATGNSSNGIIDLSNISTANWNIAVQLVVRKNSGPTSTSPVLSYSRGGIAYVPYIYAEAPSNTGTYVLKCINGVIQWVAET